MNLSEKEQQEYISKPKSLICREIGVDVLIDDSLEHAFDCAKLGIDILLYDKEGNYRWNQSDYHRDNVNRMTSWKQIFAQFPKPTSPLKYCYTTTDEEEEEEEDEQSDFYSFETIEVEPLTDDEEEITWRKDNQLCV